MAQHGTTSLLATIMTQSPDVMLKAAENVAQYSNDPECAHIRGIYLEGPFFCDQYKGAQHPQHLRLPEQSFLDKLQKASNHQVKALSLAPELPGAIDFIRQQKQMKIFMGHTASDYATAVAAIEAGATGLTHSFNAMTPLHHRKPGILAAAMEAPSVFCECICDGFHVHPAMVALLYRQVGRERFCMISDSLRPTGLSDGAYTSGGLPITVSDGKAYLENGTIAGSTSYLLDEVRNLVRWGICSVEDSLYAASAVPAKAVGIYDTVGSIAPGKAADLLVLDKNLQLQQVYIAGKPLSQK
jgi:N-acetylglucosamine-6-phosphate deacetylase